MIRIPTILVLCALIAQVGAATYYIDSAVGASGNGQSWATAWKNIPDATGLRGGDTVFISGGSTSQIYNMGDWLPPSGDLGNPIRFRVGQEAGRNGMVIFDGAGHHYWIFSNENGRFSNLVMDGEVVGSSSNHMLVQNYDQNTIYIDAGGSNLTLRYITAFAKLRAYGCNGIAYEHLILGPTTWVDGLIVGLGSGTGYTSNSIRDCSFYAYYQHGANASGGDGDDIIQNIRAVTVSNCRFIGVYTQNYAGTQHQDGIQCADWVRVEGCYFENMANYMFYGEFFGNGGNEQLFNNVFNYSDPVLTSQSTCCIAIGSSARGLTLSNIILANNTCRGGGRGIALGGGYSDTTTTSSYVVNNLLYNTNWDLISSNPGGAPQLSGTGIMCSNNKQQTGTTVSTSINNGGSSPNSSPVTFVNASADDFHLASSDVGAKDQGSAWPATYISTDLDGNTRPQGAAWDIGAYEYAGGGTNQPPMVALTIPANGASFAAPATIRLAANASDSDGTVTKVDFYNGSSLLGTDTTSPYSFTWSSVAAGSYTLTAKAYDNVGAATTSTAVNVTVTQTSGAATSIWPSTAVPANPSDADSNAVEVGVRFRSDMSGTITGVRFYKGTGNTGTHVGHLWSRTGALLGSVTFTGESTSGWQQAAFAAPIAISANTTYLASYHTDVGHYAGDNGFFTGNGVDRAPLHALADDVDGGDGVYVYGASAFPSQTWQGSNYWVDVVFASTSAPNQPPSVALTSPANGASFTAPATISIAANASDSDGTIAKVEFYNGASLIGTDTTSPYAFTWSSVAAGSYALTAKAYDNTGATATSATMSVTVTTVTLPPPPPGNGTGIARQWWLGIAGVAVSDLTGNAAYPANPSGSETSPSFEAPTDVADDYGQRMSGYVTAPTAGAYVFTIAGDDNCELWLATDGQPTSKQRVASVPGWTGPREWSKYAEQRSGSIQLAAGQRCYIEALMKEASGGDNLAVAWQMPTGVVEAPIPGNRLTPFIPGVVPTAVAKVSLAVDNHYTDLYVNGAALALGAHANDWTTADTYTVSGAVGTIAVRAVNWDPGHWAGLIACVVQPDGSVAVSDASWRVFAGTPQPDAQGRAWYAAEYDDSGWALATAQGAYGVAPWGTQDGLAPVVGAQWIWAGAPSQGVSPVYLRKSFAVPTVPSGIATAATGSEDDVGLLVGNDPAAPGGRDLDLTVADQRRAGSVRARQPEPVRSEGGNPG